jgi:hypothetical protein
MSRGADDEDFEMSYDNSGSSLSKSLERCVHLAGTRAIKANVSIAGTSASVRLQTNISMETNGNVDQSGKRRNRKMFVHNQTRVARERNALICHLRFSVAPAAPNKICF